MALWDAECHVALLDDRGLYIELADVKGIWPSCIFGVWATTLWNIRSLARIPLVYWGDRMDLASRYRYDNDTFLY